MELVKFKYSPLQFDSCGIAATTTLLVIAEHESDNVKRIYKAKSEVVMYTTALNSANIRRTEKLTGFQEKLFALPDYTELKKEFEQGVLDRKMKKVTGGVWADECNEIPAYFNKEGHSTNSKTAFV